MLLKIVLFFISMILGYVGGSIYSRKRRNRLQAREQRLLSIALREAGQIQNRILDEFAREKEQLKISTKRKLEEIRENICELHKNLEFQETDLHCWQEKLDKKHTTFQKKQQQLELHREKFHQIQQLLDEAKQRNANDLLKKSRADIEELRSKLLNEMREVIELESELSRSYHLDNIHHYAEKIGTRILSAAIQRYCTAHISESHSSILNIADNATVARLASDGEIAALLRQELDVEILHDSKDHLSVSIYSTDGYRREIARRVLEEILQQQCFEPKQVKKLLLEFQQEIKREIEEAGKQAASLFGITLLPEVAKLLGRLKYRTSFGQNVLCHSIEVAYIGKLLAMELGLDSHLACCSGLLHDIGKAVDQEKKGGHAEIGGDILKKYYTEAEILEGVTRHHEDIQLKTPYATVISSADAISASRPGARRETFEIYIKRLENLEAIANKIPGVNNSFAISAGRELRVIVTPSKVSDFQAGEVAKKIAHDIEKELHYPGQIKITVIREMKTEQYTR